MGSIITSLDQILLTNQSSQPQVLITGTSLGSIEEMECGHINAIVPRQVETLNLEEPIKEELMSTINPDLPPKNKEKLQQVLIRHSDCFAASSKDLGECNILTHQLFPFHPTF